MCAASGLRATAGAAPMLGYLLGGFPLGALADRRGRKPAFNFSMLLMVAFATFSAFAPDFYTFAVCRAVVGFALAGVENAAFVAGLELVGPSKRTQAGIYCWFFETFGLFSAVALAFIFDGIDWRRLQLIYTLPCAGFVGYFWLAPESARWLLQRGRNDEAKRVLEKMARVNGVDLPAGFIEAIEADEDESETEHGGFSDLFRSFNTRLKTLALTAGWVVCASLYYVLLLDQSELSSDPHLGFLATSAIQIPGYIYVLLTLEKPRFGRKRSLCAFLALSGVCLCSRPFITSSSVKVTIAMIGRFCANCSYTILHLFSAEQFPTAIRGVGMGYSYVVSRLGSILAPYILLLGVPLAPLTFGIGAFVASLASSILPETLGRPLPESLADGENVAVTLPCKNHHE